MNDLGPLAWVLDELRKSLEGAAKALKRFVWDAEAARGSDLAALDASQLRIARQQLHQAVGALEMVGLPSVAPVLRSMEAAVQKFIVQPEQCNQDAVAKIEYASFAVTEYLEGILAGKAISAVSLFPQYRDVQMLLRADRIHPADLWPMAWRWVEPSLTRASEPRSYDANARAALDQAILQLMKGKAPLAARQLSNLSLGFSVNQADKRVRIFWIIAAAYFEALAIDVLSPDLYVRRAASRILLQYTSLAKGDISISDRLAQDLIFFCAQAASDGGDHPVLSAVRSAYGLAGSRPVDYELVQFGRFDPALLSQARKRITSAKESWSSLSAGDTSKFRAVADQFSLVADSLVKLHPPSELLAQALIRAIDGTVRSAQTPRIELAMEVATSVLYLEAAFDDLDPNDPQLTVRTANLAQRLEAVSAGGEPQPLESWMEELYSRVSDKQTMGSVVGELRVSLGELEKALDIFFRSPQDKTTLQAVPGKLSQMRGVLSVLGLDQASRAVLHMKESVEQMLDTEIDEQQVRSAGTFEHLGNNLGALSFLIDMLNYQPALAKKLFVYDDEKGELKPLMGRSHGTQDLPPPATVAKDVLAQELVSVVREAADAKPGEDFGFRLDALATHAALAEQPELARNAREAALALSGSDDSATASALSTLASSVVPEPAALVGEPAATDFEEDDLQDVFLEEARDVIGQALLAVNGLEADPADASHLTVLRRAFHTLKGSSRMVGLAEFGDAAWAFEQLVNSWLADQKSGSPEFRALSSETIGGFDRWISDIAANQHATWSAEPFRLSAEAMRNDGQYLALNLSAHAADLHDALSAPTLGTTHAPEIPSSAGQADPLPPEVAVQAADVVLFADEAFDFLLDVQPKEEPAEIAADAVTAASIEEIDFDSLFDVSGQDITPADLLEPPAVAVPHGDDDAEQAAETIELSSAEFDSHFETGATMPEPVPVAASGFLLIMPAEEALAPEHEDNEAALRSLPDTPAESPES
ncbi:MAG: Hpt domain-containing protein, partial [Polaromonas sp.]